MDIVSLTLGLLLVALGLLTMLTAWLHKSPGTSMIASAATWPRKYQDRTQLALSGAFTLVLGILFSLDFRATDLVVLLALAAVLIGTGMALGLRSTAV